MTLAGVGSRPGEYLMEYELLSKCGFFRKYMGSREAACKGLIVMYCRGSNMNECQRKAFRKAHGSPPPDNMLPNGKTLTL